MGHYDSDYEDREEKARSRLGAHRAKAKKLLEDAVTFAPQAAESALFEQKIREAIYWLENNLG